MSHIEIIIPCGLPNDLALFNELQKQTCDSLATIISLGKRHNQTQASTAIARAVPHEAWLSQKWGLSSAFTLENSPRITASLMRHFDLLPREGVWFTLQPAHIHLGMNQMVLAEMQTLALTPAESKELFLSAQAYLQELDGITVEYGDENIWFLHCDRWRDLQTSTPESAYGHDIKDCMPAGKLDGEWRRILNEIQMLWHNHDVNLARKAAGSPIVNGLWLWGACDAAHTEVVPDEGALFYMEPASSAILQSQHNPELIDSPAKLLSNTTAECLLVIDTLRPFLHAQNGYAWLEEWQKINDVWLTPILRALKDNQLTHITLHLNDRTTLSTFILTRRALRKFWVKRQLTAIKP